MIENTSSRTNISLLILPSNQTARTETPRRWQNDSSNVAKIVPLRPHSGQQTAERLDRGQSSRRDSKNQPRSTRAVEPAPTSTGVNPRQWLLMHNPRLANLVTEAIGDRWITHLEDLQQLIPIADDPGFQSRWRAVRQENKRIFAAALDRAQGVKIDVDSLFDLQLQPIVGRERHLLNILHIITLYHRIKEQPSIDLVPRTSIFGDVGAASPADGGDVDWQPDARSIVMLIESLAQTLAADPDVRGRLRVVYVPHAAGLTDQMYRAADLTEQIATAGMEDVNLNHLILSANGALSICSASKANHLLQQAVGADNCFSFGLAIPEIALFKEYGYDPCNYYKYYAEIRQAIDSLMGGLFTAKQPGICRSLVDLLLEPDEHMVLADYVFYRACQARVSEIYRQKSVWTRMSILNVAGLG